MAGALDMNEQLDIYKIIIHNIKSFIEKKNGSFI